GRRPNHSPGPTMCRERPRPRTSPSDSFLGLELEAEVLDHVVGQQPVAHLLDPLARVALVGGVKGDLDVLADTDVVDLAEAQRGEALLDGDALRVVDDGLRGHDHARSRLHISISRSWPWAETAVCRPVGDTR